MMAHIPPFATAEAESETYPADFHMIARKQDVTDKAGKGGFDQAVYLANRAANAENLAHSKARNNAGDTPYSLHGLDASAGFVTKEYHMQQVQKPLPDKIGAASTFDSEAYRQSLADKMTLQQELKEKRHGSAAQEGGSGGNSGSSCPFATASGDEVAQQWQRSNYHAKSQPKSMADKVGADKTFEPSVYSHNIQVNKQQQADSLQRSYVGSGDILAFHPGGLHK